MAGPVAESRTELQERAQREFGELGARITGRKKREGEYKDTEGLTKLREQISVRCSAQLAQRIIGVYKNGGKGADYGLVIEGVGDVSLGDAALLLQPRKVKAAIFDVTGITITTPKQRGLGWDCFADPCSLRYSRRFHHG